MRESVRVRKRVRMCVRKGGVVMECVCEREKVKECGCVCVREKESENGLKENRCC